MYIFGSVKFIHYLSYPNVVLFTKEVKPWLAKHPMKINGRLSNLELTSLSKEFTDGHDGLMNKQNVLYHTRAW